MLTTNGFPRSVKCKLYVYQPVGTLSYSFLTVTYKLFCIFRMFKCRNLQNDRQLTGSAKPVSHVLMNPTQLPTQDLPNSPSDWLASLVAFSTQTVKSHSSSAFAVFWAFVLQISTWPFWPVSWSSRYSAQGHSSSGAAIHWVSLASLGKADRREMPLGRAATALPPGLSAPPNEARDTAAVTAGCCGVTLAGQLGLTVHCISSTAGSLF